MQTPTDIEKQFFDELGFTVWHYIAFILAGFSGSAFFLLMDRVAFGWSMLLVVAGAAGILPMLIPYLRTSQLGQFEPLRRSVGLSWRALVPSRTVRQDHPWLFPMWLISISGYHVSFVVTLIRFAVNRDSPSN